MTVQRSRLGCAPARAQTLHILQGDEILPAHPAAFKNLTGAEWIERMQVPLNAPLDPYPTSQQDSDLQPFLAPLYAAYKASPPRLYLSPGAGIGLHKVCALDRIKPGTIVTEYLGEWCRGSAAPSSYRWGPIDGKEFRNYGPIVEDGFPNLVPFHLTGADGLPFRLVFAALDEIQPGDVLTVNYGLSHSVKVQYHTEYRREEMARYFRQTPPGAALDSIRKLHTTRRCDLSWEENIALESLIAKTQYLFQTPSALAALLCDGILGAEEAFALFDRIDNRLYLLGYRVVPTERQEEVQRHIAALKKYFLNRPEHTALLNDLLANVRVRAAVELFVGGVLAGHDAEICAQAAKDCNTCLDALQQNDQETLKYFLERVLPGSPMHRLCHRYALELRSPLACWIKTRFLPDLTPEGSAA